MSFEYPPRPELSIAPSLIPFYENKGWVAQLKKNGTCSTVMVPPNGQAHNPVLQYWTRHGEAHKAWGGHPEVTAFFQQFPDSYFVFELLHSKGPEIKNTAYVFDVLRFMGQPLYGKTLLERLEIIERLKPATDKVLIAETHVIGLRAIYEALNDPLDEGLVLKDPNSTLATGWKSNSNGSWQVKCRKTHKNYSF